jgi:3-phenylpropionate/trans-cinnamate dioxygenase ferredoxin reductase subunit
MPTPEHIVIVGASLTGAKAAETLRGEGYDGSVALIGAEPERPYERPPLSKEYLQGKVERETAYVHDRAWYGEQEVDLRTATTVEAVDVDARTVSLAGGERLEWDRLLLSVGAEPRRLSVPGGDLEGVHYLRTIGESDDLRGVIERGGRLVVIGAGWIGCEVAASARQGGMEVTILERLEVPLSTAVGPEVGRFYAEVHRDHGVDLRTGVSVQALEGAERVERVRLEDGRAVDADAVVVGVGVAPRTALAEGAGLAVENGVLVDERLQTSAPDVFAAGDIANHLHPFYGRRVRVEHWANALNQGPTAARSMMGSDEPYARLPYFFSDQYDVGMEYSGLADPESRVVFRGDPATRETVAFWLDEAGAVLAGMNINVWDVNETVQALIRSRAPVDERRLTDPDVPLADLVPGGGE